MILLTKNVLGAGAAAAALVSMSVPAQARDGHYKKDKISAGEVIAGVAILGGIAAVLASSGKKDRYDDRDYRYNDRNDRNDRRYGHNGYRKHSRRAAVNKCISNVEHRSNRYNRPKVTQIGKVKRTRYGFKIKGKLAVRDGYNKRGRYARHNGYRGNHGYDRGYNTGKFTCYVERGRIVDVRYKGFGNWR